MSFPSGQDPSLLEDLPADILLQISDFFIATPGLYATTKAETNRKSENAERRQTLHSLTLTCRKLHSIFQPALYRSFIQTPNSTTSARLLVRTLVNQPSLRRHIQYIETTYTKVDRPPTPLQSTSNYPNQALPFDQVVYDQWQEFGRHFSMIQWRSNLQQTKPFDWFYYESSFGRAWVDQEPEAYIAFIMAMTPNLNMVAIFDLHILYTATLASRAYTNAYGLRSLWLKQRASVRNRETGSPLRATSVVSESIRVAFPVSEHLTLVNAYSYLIPVSYDFIPRPWFFGPDIHGLRSLTLDACEVSADDLHKMVSKHTSLKHFALRWGACFEEVDLLYPQAIDLVRLKSTLSASRYMLEYLILDAHNAGQMNIPNQIVRSIGSLRCFSALKYLEVCNVVLWGHNQGDGFEKPSSENLPDSLEVLVIRSKWSTDVEQFLREISKQDRDKLPKLKLIDCSWALITQSRSTEVLGRQFKDLGIELR